MNILAVNTKKGLDYLFLAYNLQEEMNTNTGFFYLYLCCKDIQFKWKTVVFLYMAVNDKRVSKSAGLIAAKVKTFNEP